MEKCLNCDYEFSGNYCSNCGQKSILGKLTFKIVFSDFLKTVFSIDSTLYKTLIGMLIKPGKLVKTYLEGKRSSYLPPFQFFLLLMTIYLLVLNYFGNSFFDYINHGLHIENNKISSAILIQSIARKNLNILFFLMTPIIAISIHVFYKKIKYNAAEIVVFTLYIMGIGFLLSSIIILLGKVTPNIYSFKALISFGYFPFAIIQFTDSKSFLGIIKALLTVALSYFAFAILILFFVSLYVFVFLM